MSQDVYDGAGFHFSPSLSALLAEDTGFQGDEEEEDEFSDDDSDSFNSTRTDATFDPSRSGDWSDEFNTAENSREHSGNLTPTNQVLEKWTLLYLVAGTPIDKKSDRQFPTKFRIPNALYLIKLCSGNRRGAGGSVGPADLLHGSLSLHPRLLRPVG